MRVARLGSWVLLALHVVFAVLAYQALPASVPMRIGFDGTPGNYVPRSIWSWFLLPAVALLLQLGLGWLTRAIRRRPELFNFPAKERFLALSEARRAPVIDEMVFVLDATAFGAQAILVLALQQLWDAAIGTQSTLGIVSLPLFAVLLAPALLLLTARVSSAVERAEREGR